MDADRPETIQAMASQFRQALHACSVHAGGPLAAVDRCLAALDHGALTPAGWRRLGEELVRISQARLAALRERAADTSPDMVQRVVDRETRMTRFVTAVFHLDTPRPPRLPARLIAVVGKGRNCPPELSRLGRQVGEVIGEHRDRCALLTGGLGGVMASAADGAHVRGGTVVALLPGAAYRTSSPSYADLLIDTGMPAAVRNIILVSAAAAVVALPGSHGTWQEMISAVDLDKPVWAVGDHTVTLPGVHHFASVDMLREPLNNFLDSRSPDPPGPGRR